MAETDAERYGRAKAIFADAIALTGVERASYLQSACEDKGLLSEVESLIAYRDEAGDFMQGISAAGVVQDSLERSQDLAGKVIGNYKIVREVGRGGMGLVFLAERQDFHQQAALKLIKRGMDSDAIIDRFRREREILASLNHPNIARLYDGGTTDGGVPYFVMEYVDGVNIDAYFAAHALSIREKLTIFLKVCDAITFAHQKLVVHRDLKPTNIIVTADGEPKLLDFGIAKLLNTTEASDTQTIQRALTPAYASPEHMRGEPIGTTSDVYSLGKVLSELVDTGKADADLKNVIAMALRDESNRRYASVEKFADDLRRFLDGRPVSALPDTFGYRFRKFVGRNRFAAAAGIALIAVLAGGIAATLWQARQARLAGEKAERRAENLRRLSTSFAVDLHNKILNLPGSLEARQFLLTRAVEQLDTLASESDNDPTLQDELAEGYYNLGLLPNHDLAQVEESYQKGVALCLKALSAEPQNAHFTEQFAKGNIELANVEKVRGRSPEVMNYLEKAANALNSVAVREPLNVVIRRMLYEIESTRTAMLFLTGKGKESLESAKRERELGNELQTIDVESDDFDRRGYVRNLNICKSLIHIGEYASAIEMLRTDIANWTAQQTNHPSDTRYGYEIWVYQRTLSTALERSGDKRGAVEALQTALDIIDALRRGSLDDVGYQRNTSYSLIGIGQFWLRQKEFAKALTYFVRARELSEKIYAADPDKGETIADLARIYGGIGRASNGSTEAQQNLRKSLLFYQKALAGDPENAFLRRDYAETLGWLGNELGKLRTSDERDESKDLLIKSSSIWLDLRKNNLLSAFDLANPENETLLP